MISDPFLSVVLPVYNAAKYLRLAIESLLSQSYQAFELIAVDDGSTDASTQILSSCAAADARIKVVSRPNTGIVGALNDGLTLARGSFVARMDADDIADVGRFERQLSYLEAHPECVALGSAAWFIDSAGAIVDRHDPPTNQDGIVAQLLEGNGGALLHPSAIFRRSALAAVQGYDARYCRAEDVDLYFRLLPHGTLANLQEPLLYYRQHAASSNFVLRTSQRRLVREIVERERQGRGLQPFDPDTQRGASDLTRPELHRRWACGARRYGTRRTALRHALAALGHDLCARQSWRTLRYVLHR